MGEINSSTNTVLNTLSKRLAQQKRKDRFRSLSHAKDGIHLIANDYHGFSKRPIQSNAPSGAGGSRLLGGNALEHTQLEHHIADALQHPRALVYPSGFQCHQSVLETLLSTQQFVVIGDHLNHACLQSGIQRSEAPLFRFRHNQIEDCHKKLKAATERYPHLTPMIVIESLHSMDGQAAPLEAFCKLKKDYQAWLLVDEAHAVGVCGKHHLGLADELNLAQQVDVLLGTFSKGLGIQGAFVASHEVVIEVLLNFAKGFIYTTALSPAMAETTLNRLQELNQQPQHVTTLRKRIQEFAALSACFDHHDPVCPIFHILFDNEKALWKAHAFLEEKHIYVGLVRPPTYPKPMMRVCLNSAMPDGTWHEVLQVFSTFFKEAYDA